MKYIAFSAAAALTLIGSSQDAFATEVGITRAPTPEAFAAAFCAADRTIAHVFVVPLVSFEADGAITCDDGVAGMRMVEPEDDPGHVVLNIDPIDGVDDSFDCDAKADVGMREVALNCLPANAEAADHRK